MTSEAVSSVSVYEEPTSQLQEQSSEEMRDETSEDLLEVISEEPSEEIQDEEDDSEKYSMTLKELREAGYIEELCEKYGMSLYAFDTISTIESSYGVHCNKGNAWGWTNGRGYQGLADNWYDASEIFIQKFVESPHYSQGWPTKSDMRTYCPNGAYDNYFD